MLPISKHQLFGIILYICTQLKINITRKSINLNYYRIMKDKETLNLLLIMVLSIILLIFLYLPEKKQNNSAEININNHIKEVHLNIHAQNTNPTYNQQLIEFQKNKKLKKTKKKTKSIN